MAEIKSSFKKTVLFFALLVSGFVFASDGIMWGEKDIRVIKTQWFDIIYSRGSAGSAAVLAQKADSIYYEIAEMYGRTPQARMPVVLSPNRESSNAYFSVQFYNHIVIYDTAAAGELEQVTNDLLSAFRHELTHAFTYNMKNDFWTGFDRVFGDAVNPAGLFITAGWSEGATLTSESANGEGRLNDGYSKHIVKQAKIENDFPDYDDIQGASDRYPPGAYYYFNGMFSEWLQKNYGMHKYAEFWYKCVNFKTISTRLAFKKVYGIKLLDAWDQFADQIEVPDIPSSPLDSQKVEVRDFFDSSKKKYSAKNKSGAVFSNITASENYIAWLEEKSGSIFIVSKKNALDGRPKPKKLFSVNGVKKISLSRDARYLAVSYISQQTKDYTARIKIYDLEKRRWIYCRGTGLDEASVVKGTDGYYLVCRKFYSQSKKILIKKFDSESEVEIKLEEPFYLQSESASCFTDIGNGQFAFIHRRGLLYSVCISDLAGRIIFEKKLPRENFKIKMLSVYGSRLYFSYVEPESLPRLGAFDMGSEKFIFDTTDLSGGVFYPVKLNEEEFLYAGNFFRQNRLFKLRAEGVFARAPEIDGIQSDGREKRECFEQQTEIPDGSEKYNAGKYFRKGLFLPVAVVPSYSYDPRKSNYKNTRYLWFGATYVTNSPWNSNNFLVSAGYNPFTNSAGLLFSANGGTDDSLFKWNVQSHSEFDFGGWKQSGFSANLSLLIPFAKTSAVAFSQASTVFAGRGNNIGNRTLYAWKIFPTATDQKSVFYAADETSLYYTNVHRTGEGLFEKGGVSAGASFLLEAAFDLKDSSSYNAYAAQISPFIKFSVPKLIPVNCTDNYVYNFPAEIGFAMFNAKDSFFTATIDALLFSMDIQKALPVFTAIFVNRFYFSAGYAVSAQYKSSSFDIARTADIAKDLFRAKLSFIDYISFTATLGLTPNFGIVANTLFYTEFKFQTRYYFNTPDYGGRKWNWIFSIASNFSF